MRPLCRCLAAVFSRHLTIWTLSTWCTLLPTGSQDGGSEIERFNFMQQKSAWRERNHDNDSFIEEAEQEVLHAVQFRFLRLLPRPRLLLVSIWIQTHTQVCTVPLFWPCAARSIAVFCDLPPVLLLSQNRLNHKYWHLLLHLPGRLWNCAHIYREQEAKRFLSFFILLITLSLRTPDRWSKSII